MIKFNYKPTPLNIWVLTKLISLSIFVLLGMAAGGEFAGFSMLLLQILIADISLLFIDLFFQFLFKKLSIKYWILWICELILLVSLLFNLAPNLRNLILGREFETRLFEVSTAFALSLSYLFYLLKGKKLWLIVLVILIPLASVFCIFIWPKRHKTLIVSKKKCPQFIVIEYNVTGAPALPIKPWSWSYEIKIPEDGVFRTSSKPEDDLPATKVVTTNGIVLNGNFSSRYKDRPIDEHDSTTLTLEPIGDGETTNGHCNGTIVYFRAWVLVTDSLFFHRANRDDAKVLKAMICK